MNGSRRRFLVQATTGLLSATPVMALAAPNKTRRYLITRFGAKTGGVVNTIAIQKAIDTCAKQGGGTVIVPTGTFVSGSLVLKQGVGLELRKGAVLRGSDKLEDYPLVMRRFVEAFPEPLRMALLNAKGLKGLRITGPGMLNGPGEALWHTAYETVNETFEGKTVQYHLPQLAFLQDCEDLHISGVTFKDSAFWNLHLYRCRRVLVEDTRLEVTHRLRAPSSDGIDIDSCQDVTVRRCYFSVEDDCIALKGTQGPRATAFSEAPPTERIHIQDCLFAQGLGCVTFGSNATIVRDITVTNITNTGDIPTIRFKIRPDTPGQIYERVRVKGVKLALSPDAPWSNGEINFGDSSHHEKYSSDEPGMGVIINARLTHGTKVPALPPGGIIRDIVIEDVSGTTRGFGNISGNATTAISDITLRNINVTLLNPDRAHLVAKGVQNLTLDNVQVNGAPAIVDS